MIGIQVLSHGKMSEGMIDSARMIVGEINNVLWRSLQTDTAIETFEKDVFEDTRELDDGDGILIFVDIFAASPYRTAIVNSRKMSHTKYKVISGVNLPLLIEAITSRETMDLEELYQHLLDMREFSIVGWEIN